MSHSLRSTPLRVREYGDDRLFVGLTTSLVACQHIDSFLQIMCTSGPSDGLRSITPYAPGVGAPDQRFSLHPLSSLFTRRPRIAYGSSNIHDTNDSASACGIDGLHKFLIFPLAPLPLERAQPRLNLSFPCLPASVRCFSSSFSTTSIVTPRPPGLVPDDRTVVLGRWLVGSVELMGWRPTG